MIKEAVEVLRKAINEKTIHVLIPIKAKAMFLNKINLEENEKNIEFDIPISQIIEKQYLDEALLALEKLDRLEKWLKEEYNKIEGKQTERELFILEIVERLEKKGVVKA